MTKPRDLGPLRWSTWRILGLLPVLLMLAGIVGLAIAENSLETQKDQLSLRIQHAHGSVEPLTNIRRDVRKGYVALLELWLAPKSDWPRLREGFEAQIQTVQRQAREYSRGVVLSQAELQQREVLAEHIAIWAGIIERNLERAAEPDVVGETRGKLGEIDQHCAAILAANKDAARQADDSLAVVKRRHDVVRIAIIALRPLLVAYVVVWYLRKRTARRIAEALSQRKEEEDQTRALEHLVRERTAELEASHAQLSKIKGELEKQVHQLANAHNQLVQAEKLQAVGQLAAGIAHEINTPTQFIGDGLHFLKEAFVGYQRLIAQYRRAVEALAIDATGAGQVLVEELRRTEDDVDLSYLNANVPSSFVSCMEGTFRISTIVEAMKEFAQPDQREKSPADLNHALQATLTVGKNDYAAVAEVIAEWGDLPPVLCHVGDLNQVFLNLVINAAHAIGDVVNGSGNKGTIRIKTSIEDDHARIDIADSGCGISEAIRHRVFDPFFTTQEVGKGTGQGLAVARSIIVTKHGGTLTFDSEVGKGTTFTVRLPINGK